MTDPDPRNFTSPEARADFYFGVYDDFDPEEWQRLLDTAQGDRYRRDVEMLYTYERYRAETGIGGSYRQDMDRVMRQNGATGDRVLVVFGDRQPVSPAPVFTKTRRVGERNGILLRLNHERHWRFREALKDDIPWEDKLPETMWRGAPTGYQRERSNPRLRLVREFGGVLDVGFSKPDAQGLRFDPALVRGPVGMAGQLRHKYLLSVEGNDIATNLKWILASNSVPVMPVPTIESWLMESRLLPYFHYVPVERDFSDLMEMLDWCRAHDDECRRIAENGKAYMRQFDEATDEAIEKRLYARFRALTGARPAAAAAAAPSGPRPRLAPVAPPPPSRRSARPPEDPRISELKTGFQRDPGRTDQYGDPYFLKEWLRRLLAAGRWDEAQALIPACESSGPKGWHHILFGRALDAAGRRDAARAHWERFAEERPRHSEARLRLREVPNLASLPSPFREILARVPDQAIGTIFDVGANEGQSCLVWQRAFPQARIHAFEPVPDAYARLSGQIPAGSGIAAHNLALSDRAGTLTFTRMGHSTMNRVAPEGHAGATQEVEAVTLAAFCADHGIDRIDVLKIDTEGHDLAVLKGCGDMLARTAFIQCEASANRYNTFHNAFTEIFDFLSERDFHLFDIHGFTYEPANGGYPVLRRFDPVFVNAAVTGPLEGVIL